MGREQYVTLDVKAKCESKLGIKFRENKEANGWFAHEGRRVCRITIPLGRKPIPPGTYRSMARQLKLTNAQLDALVDCPLKLSEYEQILKDQCAI